jgi:hypothetical protein
MKWFILVLMMGTFSDGSKDTFLFFEPEFDTVEQCQEYVYRQAPEIKRQMMIEYQGKPIDTVYCVREDKLENLIKLPGKSI